MSLAVENPIVALHICLQQEMLSINTLTLDRIQSKIGLVQQVAQHLIQAGGKRLRPLLTLACSRLFSDEPGYALHLATAVELIHTATLLHDDVIDESPLRRGQPTASSLWGNAPSVLVGDFLFSKAFELMVETKNQAVLHVLSRAAACIAEGEVLQLTASSDIDLSLESYLEIIGAKTASLFAAACQVGGMIVGMPQNLEEDLYQFGYNLGIIFQMTDDLLDYNLSGTYADKAVGNDFYEGKVTFPVLVMCQEEEGYETWKRYFHQSIRTPADFEQARQYLIDHNIFQKCHQKILEFTKNSKKLLLKMPFSMIRNDLENLIDYCVIRSF